MNLKLKFDKDAVVRFCLEHAEKFVLAVVVLCFVVMIVSALGRERFEKTPEQREAAAANAKKPWEATNQAVPAECKSTDYPDIVETTLRPVNEKFYRHLTLLDPPLFESRRPRGEPPLLAVQKLRGIPGRAPFNLTAATLPPSAGRGTQHRQGSSIRGQRWIVITGLVPIKQQVETFKEYFKGVQEPNPQTDVPKYIYYRVERAEVKGPGEIDKLNWTRFNLRKELARANACWGNSSSQEVVDNKYLDDTNVLVFPLGPRADRNNTGMGERFAVAGAGRAGASESIWDESVAYPPDIPLRSKGDMPESHGAPEPTADEGEAPVDAPEADDPFGDMGRPGMEPGGRPSRIRSQTPRRPVGEIAAGMGREADEEPDYWLFRFFDYTVEPGKQYRYRVRLMLNNPNYRVESRYLLNEDLGKKRWLETKWSEPTNVVSVPRDTRLLAVSVKPPIRTGSDPSAKMMIVKWVNQYGKEAYTEKLVVRGKVANFPDCTFPESSESGRRSRRDRDDENLFAPVDVHPSRTDSIDVDYLAEALVLDLHGGRRLPGRDRLTIPGEILLLDPDGSLVVHNELDDKAEFEARTMGTSPDADEPFSPTRPRPGRGLGLPGEHEGNLMDLGETGPAAPKKRPRKSPRR